MKTLTALAALASLALVAGCSSKSDAPVFDKPSGCAKSLCDASYDSCESSRAPATNYCSQCLDLCTDPYASPDCFSECDDMCNSPSSSSSATDYCDSPRDACRKTEDNTYCTDGIPASELPLGSRSIDTWHAPQPTVPGACSAKDIKALAKCVAGTSSNADCRYTVSADCGVCALSTHNDSTWGAIVTYPLTRNINVAGCVAIVSGDSSDTSCAAKYAAAESCLDSVCGSATANDQAACRDHASQWGCKTYVDPANDCLEALGALDPGPYDVCGVADDTVETLSAKVIGLFCGGS
jgi:hypothetical protein